MSPTLRFVPAMYAAALSGRKTQTRRVITPQPSGLIDSWHLHERNKDTVSFFATDTTCLAGCPVTYGPPGTTLPIVTTWAVSKALDDLSPKTIAATNALVACDNSTVWFNDGTEKPAWAGKSRPAMFFPKHLYHLARQARVTAVKAERVRSISESDAIAEGIQNIPWPNCSDPHDSVFWHNYLFETAHPHRDVVVTDDKHRIKAFNSPVQSYRTLWDSINATRGKGEHKGCYAWNKNPWVFATTFELV